MKSVTPLWASIVRTFVPLVVGWVIAQLAVLNINPDPALATELTSALTVLAGILYYILGRVFELYVKPKFGWLLGLPTPPAYEKAAGEVVKESNVAALDKRAL